MKSETLSLKTIINELDFLRHTVIFNETLEKMIDLLSRTKKLIEKIHDPRNAKEHYQSFIKKKITKSGKQSEISTYQPKNFENPNIADRKSLIIEHPKNMYKLSKILRQVEKVSSTALYIVIQKK